jgi:hypothetical protein
MVVETKFYNYSCLNQNEMFCLKIISFNLLANNLYKYITKLLVFNFINLTCFNDVMIFLINIYMELIS